MKQLYKYIQYMSISCLNMSNLSISLYRQSKANPAYLKHSRYWPGQPCSQHICLASRVSKRNNWSTSKQTTGQQGEATKPCDCRRVWVRAQRFHTRHHWRHCRFATNFNNDDDFVFVYICVCVCLFVCVCLCVRQSKGW